MKSTPRRTSTFPVHDLSALLAEHEDSGLSLAEFARERGVPAWRLYEARHRARRSSNRIEPDGPFVPVLLKAEATGSPLARDTAPPAFEVELVTGRVLRVPADFDAEALRRLTEVLEQC